MTGVEILATQEVATVFGFCWENFWMSLFIATILGAFVGFIAFLPYDDLINLVVGCVLGVIFGVIVGVGLGANSLPTEYETQYKVIITDEVPMKDFLDKYEIISQEGKIYTVRESDN